MFHVVLKTKLLAQMPEHEQWKSKRFGNMNEDEDDSSFSFDDMHEDEDDSSSPFEEPDEDLVTRAEVTKACRTEGPLTTKEWVESTYYKVRMSVISASFLAELSVRSPRKLIIFII